MFADTTFLVDFLRGNAKAETYMQSIESMQIFTSEINVFELVTGVYMSDKDVRSHLEKITGLLAKMIVLPFDRRAALIAGKISGRLTKEGTKIGDIDCLIAGVVIANGIKEIITANKVHF